MPTHPNPADEWGTRLEGMEAEILPGSDAEAAGVNAGPTPYRQYRIAKNLKRPPRTIFSSLTKCWNCSAMGVTFATG